MMWLTWRQARTQMLVVFGAVLVLAALLAATRSGVADASENDPTQFLARYASGSTERILYLLGLALYAIPPIIGAFWGAPLIAREIESGTHRLVWGQSISRRRWLAIKLGLTVVAAAAAAGLLSLIVTWWAGPIDEAVGKGHGTGVFNAARLDPLVFGARGIVPIAYTLLALALGVVIGLLIRRSVPAVAVTLAGVVLIQILVPSIVRQHLVEPTNVTASITAENMQGMLINGSPGHIEAVDEIRVRAIKPGDWELANQTLTRSGSVSSTLPVWVAECGEGPDGGETAKRTACFDRLAKEGYKQEVIFHKASTFWTLQWRESGVLILGAMMLSGFAFWRIRRDLS